VYCLSFLPMAAMAQTVPLTQDSYVVKQVITRMSATACISAFFLAHPTRSKVEPIGWAMFLQEGALVQNGLEDERLSRLENKFLAKGYRPASLESHQNRTDGDLLKPNKLSDVIVNSWPRT